jgi:hypothetical protein
VFAEDAKGILQVGRSASRGTSTTPVGAFLLDEKVDAPIARAACVSSIVENGRKWIGPAIGVVIVTE